MRDLKLYQHMQVFKLSQQCSWAFLMSATRHKACIPKFQVSGAQSMWWIMKCWNISQLPHTQHNIQDDQNITHTTITPLNAVFPHHC